VTARGASSAPNAEPDKNATEKAIAAAHKIWARRLPKDQEKLWDSLAKKSTDDLLSLLAYCTALTVKAVRSKRGAGATSGQIAQSQQLADALNLDMTNWWQPTAENFFGRVSKEQIIEALREADIQRDSARSAFPAGAPPKKSRRLRSLGLPLHRRHF
jgi:ParB family chromosome partitioning protein